ncbi:MAG: indole-3-glycerol phosphate synthase TrpC [bacterium]|nr:indole-3-glycerol phosphate synthase TrpC [bacterium]
MLDKILKYKKQELEYMRRQISQKDFEFQARDREPAQDFLKNFHDNDINIIAEFKRASPSAGMIREDAIVQDIVSIYEEQGAKAISVLTDEHFFKGNLSDINKVRDVVSLPILRKDFTLSEYHVYQSRANGADALLLIVSALDDYQIKDYLALASELGMKSILEVHNKEECDRALTIDFEIIGINNRDLKTFNTDLHTTEELCDYIPNSMTVISESGLKSHDNLMTLKEKGVNGFLIGEALMRAKNVGQELCRFRGQDKN